jgi:hypothetical protein
MELVEETVDGERVAFGEINAPHNAATRIMYPTTRASVFYWRKRKKKILV